MKKIICILLCLNLAAFSFLGCQRDITSSSPKVIRYDVPEAAANLDPQFASGVTERLIIGNIFEGLLTRDESGKLVSGVAESYEISPDGLTLSFKLRPDVKWSDGKRVTADDFVFAFQRMFDPELPSPFAGEYSAIENAGNILNGSASASSLGVVAKSVGELEIKLADKSPYFPENLAETPAMPCNKDFFTEARGRYGLEKKFINSNGPFSLDKWDNESVIALKPNPDYNGGTIAASCNVSLYIGKDEEKLARLSKGDTDLAEVSAGEAQQLIESGFTSEGFDNTVWCIVFNQDSPLWGNPLLRQGLSLTTDRIGLKNKLPQKYTATEFAVPPANTLAYRPYRQNVSAAPAPYDPEQGRRLLEMGIISMDIEGPISDTIIIPDNPENTLAMNIIQQGWQKNLSAYISVEAEPPGEVYNKFASGDYGMALLPLSSLMPEAVSIFSIFSQNTQQSFFRYESPLYEASISEIKGSMSMVDAADAAARAESLLLQDAVVIPIFIEKTVFIIAPGITGINATAFPSQLRFQYARR